MKLSEAYEVLGLNVNASAEDVKKRSRELMKKYHPDVNKDVGAEADFKRVNEAVERIKSGEPDVFHSPAGRSYDMGSTPFNPYVYDLNSIFETMFGGRMNTPPRRSNSVKPIEDISLRIIMTFEESVTGVQRTIQYTVNEACRVCDGVGAIFDGNGCKTCGGRGIIEQTRSTTNMRSTVRSVCPTCHGHVKMKPCQACLGTKVFKQERTQQVHIPPGALDGSTLRVRGAGHAIVEPIAGGFHTDVVLHVTVAMSPHGLKLEKNDVIYTKKISLLDALRGAKVRVPTAFGEREIDVLPKTRNGDKVTISGHGIAPDGNQIVTFDVVYPDDVSVLVKALNSQI